MKSTASTDAPSPNMVAKGNGVLVRFMKTAVRPRENAEGSSCCRSASQVSGQTKMSLLRRKYWVFIVAARRAERQTATGVAVSHTARPVPGDTRSHPRGSCSCCERTRPRIRNMLGCRAAARLQKLPLRRKASLSERLGLLACCSPRLEHLRDFHRKIRRTEGWGRHERIFQFGGPN